MKKSFFYAFALLAVAALSTTSCNNSSPKMDEKPAEATATSNQGGSKIAYVEVDSIMTQYKFCKEYSLILEKKSNNAQNTLAAKSKQLQAAAANFQQKMQNNGFSSREEAQRVQAAIQRQDQDLQTLQARLQNELAAETQKFNQALHDSLQNFLKSYNKDKNYDLIISKSGDNILYAAKSHDITNDVINGLNKRYKGNLSAKTSEKKDTSK